MAKRAWLFKLAVIANLLSSLAGEGRARACVCTWETDDPDKIWDANVKAADLVFVGQVVGHSEEVMKCSEFEPEPLKPAGTGCLRIRVLAIDCQRPDGATITLHSMKKPPQPAHGYARGMPHPFGRELARQITKGGEAEFCNLPERKVGVMFDLGHTRGFEALVVPRSGLSVRHEISRVTKYIAKFRVDEVLKGPKMDVVFVETFAGNSCGFGPWRINERYEMFVQEFSDYLGDTGYRAWDCRGSRWLRRH